MNEVTAVSIGAVAFLKESAASFCLIFRVRLLIFLELMQSMGKFALLFVGTVTVFDKLFAELRFFLMHSLRWLRGNILPRRLFSGERVAVFFELWKEDRVVLWPVLVFTQHESFLLIIKLIIICQVYPLSTKNRWISSTCSQVSKGPTFYPSFFPLSSYFFLSYYQFMHLISYLRLKTEYLLLLWHKISFFMFDLNLEQVLLALIFNQTIVHVFVSHKYQLTQLDHILSHIRATQQQNLLITFKLVVGQDCLVLACLFRCPYLEYLRFLALHSTLNYKQSNLNQTCMHLRLNKVIFNLAQNINNKIPLSLAYPYEYTLNPQAFMFPDLRFTEVPFRKELHKPEKEHVHLTIKRFECILNGKNESNNRQAYQYIMKSLLGKAEELRDIAKQSNFVLNFKFDISSVTKSSGYYEIKPQGGVSLEQQELQYIHNYRFRRDKQLLRVEMKQRKSQLTPEEQLKKDIEQKMGQPVKQIRQKFQELKLSKQATYYNKLVEGLLSIGKKEKKSTKFQNYYIIDQIKGTLDCQFLYDGAKYSQTEVEFDTKWLYKVMNLQSEDLKRYRKRTLFDFQFWQRGNFFPIRNFSAEAQSIE